MSIKWQVPAVAIALMLASACEDDAAVQSQSAIEKTPEAMGYTRPGRRGFESTTEGDSTDRARFCDEAEASAQVAEMVEEPIIPDVSIGGVPLWSMNGEPVSADDLLGSPAEGKFCDPAGDFDDGFVFGPLNEIVVLFNAETRLIEDIQVNSAYRGVLTGKVMHDGKTEEVYIRTRDPVRIGGVGDSGGRELEEYASSAQQATRPGSWLNHANITLIYGMIRQTFFGEGPLAPTYDCVAERRCDVIYNASDEETPQQTLVVFQDSGITLVFSPEGQVLYVVASPVRKATFELGGVVVLGEPAATPDAPGKSAPVIQSALIEACTIELASDLTWAEFRKRCIPEGAARELARANYDVYSQRDAVSVGFDGVTLDFLRKSPGAPVFQDGESPADDDRLFSVTYTRSLPAPSREFVASKLAADYVARLRAHLAASLSPDASPEHPFRALEVPLPAADGPGALSDQPQRIGAIETLSESGEPQSWVGAVVAAVQQLYAQLPEADRAAVNPDALQDVTLIEPFVGAVLSAFSFGRSDDPAAFTVYQTTANERWSVGISHYIQDGLPYRMIIQYSLFFGAVTAVTIERGTSDVDDVFSAVLAMGKEQGLDPGPYYDVRLASPRFTFNPFRLGGAGIVVKEADRKLDGVTVELAAVGTSPARTLVVPGALIEDRAGYLVPLRGERVEFVPANQVTLAGKETVQFFFVLPDGTIGRIQQNRFKGTHGLCPGLALSFGDNVRAAIDQWHAQVGDSVYQNCELVFQYSQDGHLLEGVSSLANRVQFITVAERATNVAMWR